MSGSKAERCDMSGHTQLITGDIEVNGALRSRWAFGETTTCNACGQTVRFRARASDRPPLARILPHRVDGSPTR